MITSFTKNDRLNLVKRQITQDIFNSIENDQGG